MSERWCDSFTNHININSVGYVKPCCMFAKGKRPATEKENVFDWYLNAYKDEYKEGIDTPGCYPCKAMEEAGMISRRSMNFKRGKAADNEIVYFDISFGNVCNLKCRMCESRNSTKWIADEQFLTQEHGFDLGRETYKKREMHPKRVEQIVEYMNNSKSEQLVLEVKGGEPFVTKAFLDFIERLSDETKAKTKLNLFTNGSGVSDYYIKQLSKFKLVDLRLSVEATGKMYEYIRGGDKHTLNDSIKFMTRMNQLIPNIKLGVSVTITMYNIFNLKELSDTIEYYEPGRVDKQVFNNVSHQPNWLAPGILPDEVKQQLIDMYPEDQFSNFVNYLKNSKHDPALMSKCKKFTELLDQKRNENLYEIEPRFKEIFSDY